MRIVHVSDIHFWHYAINPLRLLSKRLLGMSSLVLLRARRFRLERASDLVERVSDLDPDHILITGDLTTTALPKEFHSARLALAPWLDDPARVTIVPGNHDRYTMRAHRSRRFERYFGAFCNEGEFPFLRMLDSETAILGLDPTKASITARGELPSAQMRKCEEILAGARAVSRLLVACHYPVAVPPDYRHEYAVKPMVNADEAGRWLATIGAHLYCCGHVHAAWVYQPPIIPNQLCVNAGAPLLRDRTGHRPPGFLEIILDRADVTLLHHAWTGESWEVRPLHSALDFFANRPDAARHF
jgi:3',5'-cyclic AMP phosphodiesterase CpdA